MHQTTEGPFGLQMMDAQARMLEDIVKTIPEEDRQLQTATTTRPPAEVLEGERTDVSWITTEEIDRDREIIVAKGMNDSHYRLNPIVTWMHYRNDTPAGKSLWRKKVKDGQIVGIKAKTHYPPKPTGWPEKDEWRPDTAFQLIKAGLMSGKSISFITLKSHQPAHEEITKNPELAAVRRIVDEWLLIEYCVAFLPTNQTALVEAVSKGLTLPPRLLDDLKIPIPQPAPPPQLPEIIPHTTWEEIERCIRTSLNADTITRTLTKKVQDVYDRMRGKVQ